MSFSCCVIIIVAILRYAIFIIRGNKYLMQLNEDFIEQISDEDVQQQESQIDGDYSFVMTFFDDNGIHDFELSHLGRLISSLCETMPFIVRYKVD